VPPVCSINIGNVTGGLTNRTAATCSAGMRSKAARRIEIHFHRLRRPREATPFTRLRGFFEFVLGIFAKRPRWRPRRNSSC
jgi:hypothetical protein